MADRLIAHTGRMVNLPPINTSRPAVRDNQNNREETTPQNVQPVGTEIEIGGHRLEVGQRVRARGYCWRVQHVLAYAACRIVTLGPMHRNERSASITLVTPFDRLTPLRCAGRWTRCGVRRVLARLAGALRETVAGGAGQLLGPDLSLVPWQWAAARAVLRGETSVLLLADVVGLGKTIQAALVIAALRARGDAARVLILAPAGLREQWQSEIERLFLMRCTIADAAWLRSARRSMPASVNPWSLPSTMIASIDFVKQPEVLAAATGAPWDVLVVDEAHTLGAGTDRRVAAAAVASCARHVLLLTATPHCGRDEEFAGLCALGTLAGDDAQTLAIRRTRSDVGLDMSRRVRAARLALTGDERRMHLLLRDYARLVWRERGARSPAARLAMTVLLKRAASSAWALQCSLAQRLRMLGLQEELPDQPLLPFEEGETDSSDSEPPAVLREPGLEEAGRELHLLTKLREAAAVAAISESKLARVATLLRRTSESALVFTEYRDTLNAAVHALAASGPIAVLHGGLSRIERRDAERAFTTGRARVLLATDVASEGLNLHGRCRLVINLELPWNPVRLEQRIGRVDRIGQGRRVHAVHVVGRDTTESYVLERLAARVRKIRRSLGDAYDARPIPDTLLAAGALGQEALPEPDVPSPAQVFRQWSAIECRDREVCELLDWARRMDPAADRLPTGPRRIERWPLVTVRPRVRARLGLEPGVVLGFQVAAMSATGRTAAGKVVTVHIALAPQAVRGAPPSTLVAGVLRLAHAAAVPEAAGALEHELDAHRRHAARASARESALLTAATDCDRGPQAAPVQTGLFDRRALNEAARQHAGREHRRRLHAARLAQYAVERNEEPELRAEPIFALVLR